jgi:hypothetical protein
MSIINREKRIEGWLSMNKVLFGVIGLSIAMLSSPISAVNNKDADDQASKAEKKTAKSHKKKAAEKQYVQKPQYQPQQDTGVTMQQPYSGQAFGNFKLKGNDE